jgi:hypothetical protein
MLRIPVRIRVTVQVAADHGLRLVPLGDRHRDNGTGTSNIGVVADEVDEIGTLHQQLRHDCVVVVASGQVAINARLGFGLALSMGIVRIECLRAEAAGRRRLATGLDKLDKIGGIYAGCR